MTMKSSKLEAQSSESADKPRSPLKSDEAKAVGSRSDFELEDSGFQLVVEGVRKSFRDPSGGSLEVLRGVSFKMEAGETLAVLGASGAGKSTLLHVLGGLEEADAGSVRLDGFDSLSASREELALFRRRSVGFVFQFHHLLPDLTAEENVALPLLIARRSFREAQRAAAEMLEAVGLKERAKHRAGELSGGEQQRASIARALVSRPRLVLADEPTGNLDERNASDAASLLFNLTRERKACLILATHNERLAQRCKRRLILPEGRTEEASAK